MVGDQININLSISYERYQKKHHHMHLSCADLGRWPSFLHTVPPIVKDMRVQDSGWISYATKDRLLLCPCFLKE